MFLQDIKEIGRYEVMKLGFLFGLRNNIMIISFTSSIKQILLDQLFHTFNKMFFASDEIFCNMLYVISSLPGAVLL